MKPQVTWSGHSDDCAGFSGVNDLTEYEIPGKWFYLCVDGQPVAQVRLVYGRGWVTEIRGVGHHKVAVKKIPGYKYRDEDEGEEE